MLLTFISFYMLAVLSLASSIHQPGQGEIQARGTKTTALYNQLADEVKYSRRPAKLVPNHFYVLSFHIRGHGPIAEQWGLIVGYISSSKTRNRVGLQSTTLDYTARLYSASWIPPKGEIPAQGLEPQRWKTPGHWVWGSQPWKGAWDLQNTDVRFLGGTTAARANLDRLKAASESWVQRAGDRNDYKKAQDPDRTPINQLPFSKRGYMQYIARILGNDDKFTPT
ncbi:uncharacterized protein LY79DRAFT_573232 [Colletotrichum navitas]|uniref:Cholera enterotoxin subunit A2 n=1 Tax=Colletotrichum navitas TaxID=681940 RepID=A0AAD8PKB1_9PEZI|nr:uncharacterized protein LY79DRAFT_573232 [Colletotrichum navitas]KAK1565855.1 hypothetical protein LY79DRAFT_573232 [Colletotrichum navitas]